MDWKCGGGGVVDLKNDYVEDDSTEAVVLLTLLCSSFMLVFLFTMTPLALVIRSNHK